MSPAINRQLNQFGQRLTAWRVELLLLWGLAALLLLISAMGCADFLLRAGHVGRWSSFLLLLLLGGGITTWATRILRQRFTSEGLAAVIEHAYPELDNHLINYVQFSKNSSPDALTAAYVKSETPPLHTLDVKRMKNRRQHRQGAAALSVSVMLFVAPFFVFGNNWTVALQRMINPMSSLQPVTLTHILAVEPGNTDMRQGEPALLSVRVQGMRGHIIRVDVTPDDGRHTVYELGQISGSEPQTFSHRMPQVNTRVQYRFRAGDAVPSDWYTIIPRPPPALAQLNAVMTPPAYTRLPATNLDLTGATPPVIPFGATFAIQAVCTVPLTTLTATASDMDPVEMLYVATGNVWEVSLLMQKPGEIQLAGTDQYGQKLQEAIPYVLKADLPPVVEIVAPQGRVVLPPGEPPQIEFRVQDDYGLASVSIEQLNTAKGKDATGESIEQWETDNATSLQKQWRGTEAPRQVAAAYQVVAIDNTAGTPQVTRSAPILFNMPPAERQADARDKLEAEGFAGLQKVIELQKENIEHGAQLQKAPDGNADLWREPAERQREIRLQTRVLLANPVRPLGGRTEAVSRLYANEMVVAIDAIDRIGSVQPAQRPQTISEVLGVQSSILRQLQSAESAAEKALTDRRQTGISAMLDAMITSQADILDKIKSAGFAMFSALANRQDALSEDMASFETACTKDAASVRGNDAAFADLLDTLVRESKERRIREDMLMTAERLEQKSLVAALPLGTRVQENLSHLQSLLEKVDLQRQEGEREAMIEALGQAQEKIQRLQEIHTVMQESMDGLRGQTDKDTEMADMMAEEFVEILKKDKETLLTIPVDLHIFTDLNVGNELVEDVFSVFEEIEQKKNAKNQSSTNFLEIAYAKNLMALEKMREMKDRADDMEEWLMKGAEKIKVVDEALDRAEMPEEGVALGALAAQMDDLIGDLMEEDEDAAKNSDDGAVNHSMPDEVMGWDVMEGDIAVFSGKGKSGNQTPDHKEQDGRSNVGRQGMSSGETTAGSGTIGEGDKNIEERRTADPTQSGKVELEGEADTKATGGGKLASGKADELGMSGGVKRMDSTEEGSSEGMASLMAKQADAAFAQASLKNVRVDSLKIAAHHLRQADDAVAKGDIGRISEQRKMAIAALRRAKAELSAPPSGAMQVGAAPSIIQNAVQSGPDFAPPKYQTQVAEYYKLLNEEF